MKTIKVYLNDGTNYVTSVNGSINQISDYFINNWFNYGIIDDDMKQCVKIEFLEGVETA